VRRAVQRKECRPIVACVRPAKGRPLAGEEVPFRPRNPPDAGRSPLRGWPPRHTHLGGVGRVVVDHQRHEGGSSATR
jgi:hypothetical protein